MSSTEPSSTPPNRESRKARKARTRKEPAPQFRFGIGEWYGRSFVQLTLEERRFYASIQLQERKQTQPCPFLSRPDRQVNCWKPGGNCSLRSYERSRTTGLVRINPVGSTFRATCPSRWTYRQGFSRHKHHAIAMVPSREAGSIFLR